MQSESQKALFTQIITSHKGILFAVARGYCKTARDRQDLIQDMMVSIWQALPNYKSEYAITTWLYRIALNVAISGYRKQKTRIQSEDLTDQIWPDVIDEQPFEDERLELLEGFIQDLRDFDKALIILYLEEKSHAEIADITGLSVSNVGTRLSRIKESLRKRFTNQNTL